MGAMALGETQGKGKNIGAGHPGSQLPLRHLGGHQKRCPSYKMFYELLNKIPPSIHLVTCAWGSNQTPLCLHGKHRA